MSGGNLQREDDGPALFCSNLTSWAAPPHSMAYPASPCVSVLCMCVLCFKLGTWGLSLGADTVNMAVVIHEQPLRDCRPMRARATKESKGEES